MTAPFSATTLAKIAARQQSVRFEAVLREVREFRAYCCNVNSSTIMGVTKQPVVVFSATPNPVCLGQAIAWSFVGSFAPGSTITLRSINFGDGSIVSPAAVSGTKTYAAAGQYTIRATVTEGTGLSQTIETEVNVISCPAGLLVPFIYLSSDGGGVYFRDMTAAVPAWVARNTGLTGTALNVNFMVLRPGDKHKPNTVHELLIATDGGVYRTNNGGRNWTPLTLPNPSNAEFADSPAATVSQLIFDWVDYDPGDLDTIYVRGYYATNSRLWVYKSTAAGAAGSWSSRGVIAV